MDKITLVSPLDMHLHLRDGEMLQNVAHFSAKNFSAAVVMPNLNPPICSVKEALAYKQRILEAAKGSDFVPLMTLYLTESLNKEELSEAKKQGIFILKLYPKGATTNSESGVSEILNPKILEILAIAQDLEMILSIHGESNGFVLEREREFCPAFETLAKTFPKLRIIFEHLSDSRSLDLIEKYDNLFATLTLHHLTLSLDDVAGGALNPHLFCKPILKTKKDQKALLEIALSGHQKFSFGSDSAPHLQSTKETSRGAAGIFSAPILLPSLVELFEKHNALENLSKFISQNAQKIYKITPLLKEITLTRKPFKIPPIYSGVVPMRAGEIISWSFE